GSYAGSKIPQILKNAIKDAVSTGNYLNSSDFIRDAIKEKLQREGYLKANETVAGGEVLEQ
nr:ribbon-helix-helix domain-containing protein [Thermoproteota archaeon]